jgi:ribonuclease T1
MRRRPSFRSGPSGVVWVVLLLLLLMAVVLAACSTGTASPTPVDATVGPQATATSAASAAYPFADGPPADWVGGVVRAAEVPAEALDTLALIADDGPYPYPQDGSTFQNREGILPDRHTGFYREYTVETPGVSHRGARRLVTGDDLEVYYTDDHYDSFRFLGP